MSISNRRIIPRAVLLIAASLIACRHPSQNSGTPIHFEHLQDLTYTLTPEFPFIPVHNLTFPFSMTPIATIPKNGVAANAWHIHEHLGTHIDAPNHFNAKGMSVDQIPLEDLVVPVEVIDIRKKAGQDPDAQLTPDDIHQFESLHGPIPAHSCVMMLSGWEKWIRTPKYLGLDSMGVKHFPGFSTAAIDFLVRERQIAGIGVDVISFDPGRDSTYNGHRELSSMGKWAVENIANLNKIPVTGAILFVGAPKIGQATGGIARIFAAW